MRHDVTFPLYVEVDEIYNLACPASPVHLPVRSGADDQDQRHRRDQHAGPRQACEGEDLPGFDLGGLRRPLRASPARGPTGATSTPIGPRACYDEGKRCAETLFFDYYRQHKVRIKVARIFNTYGPHMHPQDGRVVSNFIVQALQNRPITIYGDGLQTRSFCYVDDLIDGFRKLMDAPDDITGPVNIGNPGEFTMIQLAEAVLELTGSRSQLVKEPLPMDDPKQRQPDITVAKEKLGWEPTVPLKAGLVRTIAYFDQLLSENA